MSLTILHDGLGRDSRTMAALLAQGRLSIDGKLCGPRDVHAAMFADTGAEWPHTYDLLARVAEQWASMGIPFYHLAKPPDAAWRGRERAKGSREAPAWHAAPGATVAERAAQGFYHRRLPIIAEYRQYQRLAVTSSSSCTDNHKVQPMRRALSDLAQELGGLDNRTHGAAVRRGEAQPHRILIGFTADEAQRAADPLHVRRPSYERLVFPLLEAGVSKADEDAILWASGWDAPEAPVFKSGCFMCPFQPPGWYWVLREQHPELFALVCEYEAAALAVNPRMWVLGSSKRPLPEAVAAWRERNPYASAEEVLRKEYARGCMGNPAQLHLVEPTDAPPGHYLVNRLAKAIAAGDLTRLRAIATQLHRHGLASHAERARIAAALVALAPAMEPLPPAPPTPDLFSWRA